MFSIFWLKLKNTYSINSPKNKENRMKNIKMYGVAVMVMWIVLLITGCGEEKIYKEGDLYQKEGVFYEKENDKTANGIEREYDGNSVRKETPFNDGKIDGIVKLYYSDGKLREEDTYENNDLVGTAKVYSESGHVINETPYKDGKINGTQTLYYEFGAKYMLTEYLDGKREGKRQLFREDGSLGAEVSYKDDKPTGGTEYGKNGDSRPLTNRRYFEIFGFN